MEGKEKNADRKNKEKDSRDLRPECFPGEFAQERPRSTRPEMVEVFHGFLDDLRIDE